MLNIYYSEELGLENIDEIREGCWINLVNPTEKEIEYIITEFQMDGDLVRAALDEEERSRIEVDEDTGDVLILVDIPIAEIDNDTRSYNTLPLAIILAKTCIITICLKESPTIKSFIGGHVKTFFTYKRSRFILQMLYRNATLFLQYLRQLEKQSELVKQEIYKSMRNKEIVQLLDIEHSLVYFNTSLKSNELVLEKLMRYEFIRKYPEDKELLEDTIIENKQAIEMAKIHSDILSGTMDAFASIISNNLNIVMKFLTSVTIIMAIPNMIFSFYGMNVDIPFQQNPYHIWMILFATITLCVLLAYIMARRKMF